NAAGQASKSVTANSTAGSYNVTASAPGVASPASFTLTNNPGAPATVAATSGGGQSTTVNTAFTSPLVATVTDASGNPVPGVVVTFAAPSTGAGVTFTGGNTATTNAAGQASKSVTANGSAGSYTVTAAAPGVATLASFSLTNNPGAPAAGAAAYGGRQSVTGKSDCHSSLDCTLTDES